MSTIYILKTKCNQYRVTHAQTIDNLYWSWLPNASFNDLVPTRVVESFGQCLYTRDANQANRVAVRLARSKGITGCDIHLIVADQTWRQMVKEARKLAVKEIDALLLKNKDLFNVHMQIASLQNILASKNTGERSKA